MCGFSGVANCGDREPLAPMTHVQAHRGADVWGLWDRKFPDDSSNLLGSRRPAILDPSLGGMASSVELAEFIAWNIPPNMKLKGLVRPTTEYLRPGHARHFAARRVATTQSWFCRSGRLLVGERSQGNG